METSIYRAIQLLLPELCTDREYVNIAARSLSMTCGDEADVEAFVALLDNDMKDSLVRVLQNAANGR